MKKSRPKPSHSQSQPGDKNVPSTVAPSSAERPLEFRPGRGRIKIYDHDSSVPSDDEWIDYLTPDSMSSRSSTPSNVLCRLGSCGVDPFMTLPTTSSTQVGELINHCMHVFRTIRGILAMPPTTQLLHLSEYATLTQDEDAMLLHKAYSFHDPNQLFQISFRTLDSAS